MRRVAAFIVFAVASSVLTSAQAGTNYEYNNPSPFNSSLPSQPNLAQIHLTEALHNNFKSYIGYPSANTSVVVAILDGLADTTHVDLSGHETNLIVYTNGTYTKYADHATHVSGIVGAAQNAIGIVGVNPFATLLNIPVFDDRGWVPQDLAKAAFDAATSNGARVVNMSYGPVTRGDVFLSGELNLFKNYNSATAGQGMVLVRAAGNDAMSAMNESFSGNAAKDLSNLLIVGSVDANNKISYFSNRPGNACIGGTKQKCPGGAAMMNFFLVAPGESILSDLPNNYIGTMSGTSMATPHVAGAAALVVQKALAGNTRLTPGDVAQILKQSADDLGTPGVDNTYGWGLLDVAKALQPVGTTSVATGGNVNSKLTPFAGTALTSSSVLSARSLPGALSGMIVLDEFKRAFVVDAPKPSVASAAIATDFLQELSGAVSSSTAELSRDGQSVVSLTSRSDFAHGGFNVVSVDSGKLHFDSGLGASSSYFTSADIASTTQDGRFSRALAESFFTGAGDAALALNQAMFFGADLKATSRLTVSEIFLHSTPSSFNRLPDNVAALMLRDQLNSTVFKLGVNYRLSARLSAGLASGYFGEQRQALGMRTGGAFALGDGVTYTREANLNVVLTQATTLAAFAEQSITNTSGAQSSIFSADSWKGSKYGISLAQSGVLETHDLLRLKLIRPWQVDQGSLNVHLPVGREFDGTVNYQDRTVSVATDSSPWEVGLAYLDGSESLKYGAELRLSEHHIEDRDIHEASLAAALHWSF